jgi:hypothetical protein
MPRTEKGRQTGGLSIDNPGGGSGARGEVRDLADVSAIEENARMIASKVIGGLEF